MVEQAKSMEGTKRAQWVLLGNCLTYKIINKTSPSSNVRKKFLNTPYDFVMSIEI